MDSLRLDIGSVPASQPKKADSASVPVPSVKSQQDVELPLQNVENNRQAPVKNMEKAREELVIKAANTVSNYYVVSDVRFTIFKDNGTYVTKFTNLKDGSVSYFPEPQLLKMYSHISGEPVSLVDTDA